MNPYKIDKADRRLIVTISMITGMDVKKVAATYQYERENLEKWLIEEMEKMRG